MSSHFGICRTDGQYRFPKFKVGSVIPNFEEYGKITGFTYYVGNDEFAYWFEQLGYDVPEDELT